MQHFCMQITYQIQVIHTQSQRNLRHRSISNDIGHLGQLAVGAWQPAQEPKQHDRHVDSVTLSRRNQHGDTSLMTHGYINMQNQSHMWYIASSIDITRTHVVRCLHDRVINVTVTTIAAIWRDSTPRHMPTDITLSYPIRMLSIVMHSMHSHSSMGAYKSLSKWLFWQGVTHAPMVPYSSAWRQQYLCLTSHHTTVTTSQVEPSVPASLQCATCWYNAEQHVSQRSSK